MSFGKNSFRMELNGILVICSKCNDYKFDMQNSQYYFFVTKSEKPIVKNSSVIFASDYDEGGFIAACTVI